MTENSPVPCFVLVVLAGFLFAPLVAAPAAAQDLFLVTDVIVDESANDEVTAKYNGIASAQQDALRVVMRRLVMPYDVGRIQDVDQNALALMVSDYDVADEKFGGGRYLATLSVRFIPEEVGLALRDMGIPYAMTQSLPMVVLPILDTGSARRLWDDPNPWRAAWTNANTTSGLFNLVVPLGDLADISTIDSNRALARNQVSHDTIARKYQAVGTMVAHLRLGLSVGRAPTAAVTLSFLGGAYDGKEMNYSYEGSPGIAQPVFMGQVVYEIFGELQAIWKKDNLLDFNREERLSVLVPIAGMADWLTIRERLAGMARIQNVSVSRLARGEAEIDLVFVGSTDQLRAALAQQGLELFYSPDHPLWLLRHIAGR